MGNESVAPAINPMSAEHELADGRLAMAQGILGMLMVAAQRGCPFDVSNAAWGAQTLIRDAREIYGKNPESAHEA